MNISKALLSLYGLILKSVRPNSGLTVLSFNPVIDHLFARIERKQKMSYFGNSEIEVDIMDYHGRILWIFGSNDFKVSRTVNMLLEPGMSFLDIGANYGSIGFAAIESIGEIDEIHFFEPQPDFAGKLRHTAASFATNKCHVHEIALFDQPGEMELTLAENHSGVASLIKGHTDGSISVRVEKTYDYVFDIVGEKPFGVKIDVEEAEPFILPDLMKFQNLQFIVFEGDANQEILFDILKKNSYTVYGIKKTIIKTYFSNVTNLEEWKNFHDFVAVPTNNERLNRIIKERVEA